MINKFRAYAAKRHFQMWDDGYEATHAGEKPSRWYTFRMLVWGRLGK